MTKGLDGKRKIDDLDKSREKKKKEKGIIPLVKKWKGKFKPLEENGEFHPSRYAHGKTFAVDQGWSKNEVVETFDPTATQTRSKVLSVSLGSQPYH